MPIFHAEPNRATPDTHVWMSVDTPSVFREHSLPVSSVDWTVTDWRKFRELERLAELHKTYIRRSTYRRG